MKEFNAEREEVLRRGAIDIAEDKSGSSFDLSQIKNEPAYKWTCDPGVRIGLPCTRTVKEPDPNTDLTIIILKGILTLVAGTLLAVVVTAVLLVMIIPVMAVIFSGIDNVVVVAGPGLGFIILALFFGSMKKD